LRCDAQFIAHCQPNALAADIEREHTPAFKNLRQVEL
jgi:hypothetical protein